MRHSRYHKFLRVSGVTLALVLLFDSGILAPVSQQLSDNTVLYLANAVGVSLGVPENELNVITAELTRRETELTKREADLAAREIDARDFGQNTGVNYSTYILATILFVLTVLMVLNYVLDFTRARKAKKVVYEVKTA